MGEHGWKRQSVQMLATAAALATLLVGCSDDDAAGPATTQSTAKGDLVTATSNPPRTTGFTAAREDVQRLTCTRDGATWKVNGTVRNPTQTVADYRIYTMFLDDDNELRGLLQSDVPDVAVAGTKEWTGELELDGADLTCGVRVERTP